MPVPRCSLLCLSRYDRLLLCCSHSHVQAVGPITERAIVMNVLDHSFDVLLVRFGIMKRVYLNVSGQICVALLVDAHRVHGNSLFTVSACSHDYIY
jgi:hypothetical protein